MKRKSVVFALALALALTLSVSAQAKQVEFKIGLLGDIQTLNFWGSNDINVSALMEAVMPRFGFMDTDEIGRAHV